MRLFYDAPLADWPGMQGYQVVNIEEGSIVTKTFIDLDVIASAWVSFAAYDSIDKDYVPMGGADLNRELRLSRAEILIALDGNLIEGTCDIESIEISRIDNEIDFEYVEPDWSK